MLNDENYIGLNVMKMYDLERILIILNSLPPQTKKLHLQTIISTILYNMIEDHEEMRETVLKICKDVIKAKNISFST